MEAVEKSALKIPPHSIDAEKSVLGGILLDNAKIYNCLELISDADFYKKSHQIIFQAMTELERTGVPIDLVTVKDSLERKNQLESAGGITYLSSLLDTVPTSANIEYYAKIVKEKSILRQLLSSSIELQSSCYEGEKDVTDILNSAERNILDITQKSISQGPVPIDKIIPATFKAIENLHKNKGRITGIETGFKEFDEKTAGLHPSDLVIIAGRPGMGKTAFAMNIAQYSAVNNGTKVLVFSLEMSAEQLAIRMLCSHAKVDSHKLRSGYLGNEHWAKLTTSGGILLHTKIYIDDTPGISIVELRAKAQRLRNLSGVDLIIVDYLQLMRGSRRYENRQQEISDISRSLKGLAKELSVPVIALSQLNRAPEGRTDKRPILADLRESGAIEQDADVVAFIYREDPLNEKNENLNVAEILIRKQRHGPTGEVNLAFLGYCTSFENLGRDEYH
ncbi:MAG: replicative DNA helicase [Candidatus Schekmanbacteria bacterium]|nr:replicative DNA helicase [Candidatus Schekmanbacteria bacterium]